MAKSVEEGSAFFLPVCPDSCKDLSVVLIYDHTRVRVYNIVEAPSFVHAKRQRAFLKLVAEGELHLVAVTVFLRAF